MDSEIDPVAPILKDIGDHIAVDGIGLFRDDRYITKIPPDNTIFFAFLYGKFKQGEISIDLKEDRDSGKESVMLSSLISSRKVKISRGRDDQWTVTYKINIKGSILEYTGSLDLSDDADRHKLENIISEHISDKCEEVVALMQRNKVDSLGIGIHVRNHMTYKEWKKLQWNDAVYPAIRIQCEVTAKINNYGKLR